MVEGLLYKLRMFGVPINDEARIFCDNESVVKGSTFPESTLKKKHISIAFHRIRESVAAGNFLFIMKLQDRTWQIFSPNLYLIASECLS